MKLKTALFTLLAASLMVLPGVDAQLACDVVNGACPAGDTDLLHLFARENAHAELPTQANYNWRVCCSGVPGLNNVQQGTQGTDYDVILNLFKPTDSHVQKNTESGYTNKVYISMDNGGTVVNCDYTTNPSNTCQAEFGPGYVCLVTMFQDTDSHISDCDGPSPFPIKVCCEVDADTVPPTFTLSEPSDEWINRTSFDVAWSATDDKSGVACSNVLWGSNPAGPWQPISVGATTTDCPSGNPGSGSITFGPSEPVMVTDDHAYYFTGNATDNKGNTGVHISPLRTTVDRYNPEIYINVTDDQGRVVSNGLVEPGATRIYLNFSSTDNISGVLASTLHYRTVWQGAVDSDFMTCGSAPDHGGWSNCTKEFNYDSDTTIKYYVETTDRAGNTNRTGYRFITSHMLANFGVSSLYLTMGETALVPVIVRNMQVLPDTINLSLSEYGHVSFEHGCEANDCVMSSDRRELSVININPYEERTYYVRVLSSDRGEYYPTLNAKSELDPAIEDAHALTLTTGYPVYFPGMSDFTIAFLIILSVVIMLTVSRKATALNNLGGET